MRPSGVLRAGLPRAGLPRAGKAAAVATAAALTLLTAACGSGGGTGGGGALQVYVYGDSSVKVQDAAVREFNRTSKVKVHLVKVPGARYSDKLRASMGSPAAPDVLFNWGGGSIRPYVDHHQLLDLTPYFDKDPAFRRAFLPSVLESGAIGGHLYGVPMRGMQPVVLFYNRTLFAKYHLKPPATWAAMETAITTLKAHGTTPFALGGGDAWTEQMWLEYLVDRIGGPGVFRKIQDGDSAAWGDPAVLAAARQAVALKKQGAFGTRFTSVNYTNGGAPALFGSGRAGMHLMGSWEYSTQLSENPAFARKDLAWTNFPRVPGGTGDPADVVGNPTNYWSINARTRHRAAAVAFVKSMARASYADKLLKNGDVPATASAAALLKSSPNPEFAAFQYRLVRKAPAFQLSWDQALVSTAATPMTTEIGRLFAGQSTPEQFVAHMKAVK
jgi:xylobiose transport system substrate-binding protein